MRTITARVFLLVSLCTGFFAGNVQGLVIDELNGDSGEVSTSTVGSPASKTIADTAIIGGSRTLKAEKISGLAKVSAETINGILLHSQDSTTSGNTRVLWNANAGDSNFSGLGSIDLEEDGGTAIVLKGVNTEWGTIKDTYFVFTVYDASDSSGQKASSYVYYVTAKLTDAEITMPFADFVQTGFTSAADFNNVGAMSLSIHGTVADWDISIGRVLTNGKCDSNIPNAAGRVLDDCGVCGGVNQDKDSCGVCFGNDGDKDSCGVCFGKDKDLDKCGVCFGNNEDMDDCGVCFGDNKDLDDCGVCGGGNKSKDVCGICGGDGTSCLDCLGVPNGTAKKDVCGECNGDGTKCQDCLGVPNGTAKKDICGICSGDGTSCIDCSGAAFGVAVVDACGICGGDGKSCIQCVETDVTALLESLAKQSKYQKSNALFYLIRLLKADPSYAKSARKEVIKLYNQLIALTKELPVTIQDCNENPFCTTSTEHVTVIDSYGKTALRLYRKSLQILIHPIKTIPGKCSGSVTECMKRQEAKRVKTGSMKTYAYRLYRENLNLVRKVPRETTVCK